MSRCVWALADEKITEAVAEVKEPNAKLWLFHVREELNESQFVTFAVTLLAI